MSEITVGTRELKSKLSEYLRRVKAGETVMVTEHGKPIGQIVPVQPTLEEKLAAMVAAGQAEWNGQPLLPYSSKVKNQSAKMISDLVIEERE